MSEMRKRTENLAVGAILTAVVVVLQLLGTFIRFGPFAISLVLIPIVIGAAISNYKIGAWLGFVFGVAVLLSGDATAFWVIHPVGTVVTVLLKGALCGLMAGLVYKLLAKWNRYVAVIAAAIVCPVVNTGIFLLGCKVFFMEAIKEWGVANGFTNVAEYMFLGLAGGNFLVELGANVVLSPVIFRIIRAIKKN
jgi:uncharacterized membrane protein